MESLFFNLLQTLVELNEKLTEMLKATESHNKALRENDMAAVKEVLKQLEDISAQSKSIDKKREEIQRSLEEKLQLPQGAALSDTISRAPEHLTQDLNNAAASLRETTQSINKLVQLNNILTRQALHFNEVLLKVLKPTQATYCPNGQATVPKASTSLLNKTV